MSCAFQATTDKSLDLLLVSLFLLEDEKGAEAGKREIVFSRFNGTKKIGFLR